MSALTIFSKIKRLDKIIFNLFLISWTYSYKIWDPLTEIQAM